MVAHSEMVQRIARLTPLGDVLPLIDALARPVAPQQTGLAAAFRLTLAEDAVAAAALPAMTLAVRDGWAVASGDVLDASATAPVPLAQAPAWLESGDPLPASADAVAPLDAIAWHGQIAEAVAPVSPGEGVLEAGADLGGGTVVRSAGTRLRRSDLAVLAAADIGQLMVRMPRIGVVRAGPASPPIEAAAMLIAGAVADGGGIARRDAGAAADQLDRVLHDDTVDAVIVVGGTGAGRRDVSVRALARSGRVAVHGIAISPGETAALGDVAGRPVLLLPGRIDATMAGWLLLGRPLLARLAGRSDADRGPEGILSRKVSSNLGLTEVVPVRRSGAAVEPLASGYLAMAALTAADGWILVPPDSEGYPAGTRVMVRPLP